MQKESKFSFWVHSVASLKQWNKTKLAQALGITPQHLSKILSGEKNLTDAMYAKMETLAKDILPPEYLIQSERSAASILAPRAQSILKMISELEGIDEDEAMSRAIHEYGAILLQERPQHRPPPPPKPSVEDPKPPDEEEEDSDKPSE